MSATPLQQTAEVTETVSYKGLTSQEVRKRVERGESNNFRARVGRTYFQIFRDNILNLFNLVLGPLLIIMILLQDYAAAFFSGFSVVSNSFLGMIQEIHAKRKLDQLAALADQKVDVWRDGNWQTISMYDVVLDDVIRLEPGDRIVVDGVVLNSDAMEVDESLLTGESDAIFKQVDDDVHSGSFCIAGSGVMQATAVGKNSTINRLSVIAKQYQHVKTPTQTKIDIIVEVSVAVMVVFVPMLFISAYLNGLDLLGAVRNAVVFTTTLVPQGLVLVAILSLTLGALRISRKQTLVQRVNAVESLANATVLCFDKTGTLTKNQLAVTEIIPLDRVSEDSIHFDLYQYLKNLSHLNRTAGAVETYLDDREIKFELQPKQHEIPFSSSRKWGAVAFSDETLLLGAPERIIPDDHPAKAQAQQLAADGLRILAFARGNEISQEELIHDVEPLALIVMSDQVREDIEETLKKFSDENINLKVISGDNLETVQSIARQAGMHITGAYTGNQLNAMNDAELEDAVRDANVFARIEPDTKSRLVSALQEQAQYVAMVGDGVNDVPALKRANLAIVMNDGTQISKDVADIVLLNNAMSTLPLAFHEGREITQTIYGTSKLFLVRNFLNVLFFVFIAFMTLPFPITPIQISWSTFGVVNIPATLIALNIIRPKFIRDFREGVIDYIINAGIVCAIAMTVTYLIVYFTTNENIGYTRSAVTIFYTLISMMVVWNIQGIEFDKLWTIRQHWRIFLMILVLGILTISSYYLLPDLFEFEYFPPEYWLVLLALFAATIFFVAYAVKYPILLHRVYSLLQKQEGRDEQSTETGTS